MVLKDKIRIDGRDLKTVRPIDINVGYLKRTHGSAVFKRGETTSLTTLTLGSSERDAQIIDDANGEYKDKFLLHYNFPLSVQVNVVLLDLRNEERLDMVI